MGCEIERFSVPSSGASGGASRCTVLSRTQRGAKQSTWFAVRWRSPRLPGKDSIRAERLLVRGLEILTTDPSAASEPDASPPQRVRCSHRKLHRSERPQFPQSSLPPAHAGSEQRRCPQTGAWLTPFLIGTYTTSEQTTRHRDLQVLQASDGPEPEGVDVHVVDAAWTPVASAVVHSDNEKSS
jgi:hypothetical protein